MLWLIALFSPAAVGREGWTASRIKGSPDPAPPYRVEVAFPHLQFERPLDITRAPGSGRLFVAEQGGRIVSFVDDPENSKLDLAIDLSQVHPDLTAVYGLAFHPDFEQSGFVYICYVLRNGEPDGSRVARFTVARTDPPAIDPASEHAIIHWWSGGHNGGCLKFGTDGYLYISTGDGSGPTPPDRLRAGQDVSNLLSAILRIDVDHPDAGRPYRVPDDNPLVSVAGARPEIWAYGFRNPWRMSFDRATGDLWVGDVGWQLWEMIYRVVPGGNYGWAVMEGPQPALPEVPRGPTPILPPTVSHPHSEAASITGGIVYHGDRLPELNGAYIYGDFQTGKVWALRHDGRQVTWHEEIAQTSLQLVSFGEDRRGELLLLDYERSQQIFRLTTNDADERLADFPRRLSDTGLFTSVAAETPAAGVVPYAINAPAWADYTTSQRWMAVPGTEPVRIRDNDRWEFPEGSVLAKTVRIELERGEPRSRRRLETQILHREQGSWRPYTYIWNEEQSDAELAPASGASRVLRIHDGDAPGGIREQTYRFASRAECQMCHNPWVELKSANYGVQSASPLAVSVPQWNRTVAHVHGEPENQLAALVRLGWLAGNVPPEPEHAPRLADPCDPSADLNDRARAYLHVNCAHCHQPHAGGAATIELTYGTRLARTKVLDVRPTQGTFGIAGARIIAPGDPAGSVLLYRMAKLGAGRMPRLGSEMVDAEAVALIHDWIAALPRAETEDASPPYGQDAAAFAALGSDDANVRARGIQQLTSTTRGALALLAAMDGDELPAEIRSEVLSVAGKHPRSEVRDLFERFIPAAERVTRLGTAIDPAKLLAMETDPERGRQVFFQDGACKTCHRVDGVGETLGPDLSEVGKKYSPPELLTHVLEPSRLIEPKYVQYLLETTDGRVLSGLVTQKDNREVVLQNAENKEVRVPAERIELLAPQQTSLMPELLLRDLTPQEAADLLAFLSSLK